MRRMGLIGLMMNGWWGLGGGDGFQQVAGAR